MTDPAPHIAAGTTLSTGDRLGPYEILAPLGAGGMGEVYRARDTRLGREVAIKIIGDRIAHDPHSLRRFEKEAKAIAALSHSNILAIYDFQTENGISFAVMELLRGESLADRLAREHLSWRKAVEIAAAVADGLASAHAAGIIHRDLKPANIFLTNDGQVKILDFGLAKRDAPAGVEGSSEAETASQPGRVVGTIGYMSPEQVSGAPVDARSDIFALGCILYEMISGQRAFARPSAGETLAAILRDSPADLSESGLRSPAALATIVRRCLEKNPDERFQSARDLAFDLRSIDARGEEKMQRMRFAVPLARARISIARWTLAAVVIALIGSAAGWVWHRSSRQRWALQTAVPEIARLVDAEEYVKAAALIEEARAVLPNDPTLEKLWTRATGEVSITTNPSGADVSIRPFRANPNRWKRIGTTPFRKIRVPQSDYVWRVTKEGFAPIVAIFPSSLEMNLKLWPQKKVPDGMVVVKGGRSRLGWPFSLEAVLTVDDFLIDQHEVTNEEYKRFADAGGYQRREFWTEPFVRDGRTISWEEAIASFRDVTDRPGPATWEIGSFRTGQEKHPVAGVSWYEAAAYAKFAGKTLPTVYHWTRAAQTWAAPLIVPGSNFSGTATVPVGAALSGFGTSDMAGNVKEWCLNESTGGKRFTLGGGFREDIYMFNTMDALSPWDRKPRDGFRCVKLASAPSAAAAAKLGMTMRDVSKDVIVSDDVFSAFKNLYAYDHRDLHARVEQRQTAGSATHEKITFDAAYGNERMIAHLFLPKNAAPPFQPILYFPASDALYFDRFDITDWWGDLFLKSGRAVVVVVCKGMYERRDDLKPGGPLGNPPALFRDHVIMWSKDVSRSIDYLETRMDIDPKRIGYFGWSLGASIAPVMLAMEPRLKTAVLLSGGFWSQRSMPEADGTNFAPRVTIPVLILSGRYDWAFPVETAQRPMFQRLGTPEKDKRQVLLDAGHADLPRADVARESLNWLDKYLGPVRHE